MSLQATTIIDVRNAAEPSAMTRWLRGIGVRQVRLVCGLVMFSYIFSHFFNHALGNLSYATMEAWLGFHVWWWRIPVVNFTLYTAATIHFLLGLWALYQRRHFRYTVVEVTQLVFGLSIPLLLAAHFGIARLGGVIFDRNPPTYAAVLVAYWSLRPYMIAVQFALMTVAWIHACIGLYFWLRLKPFFRWAGPFLLAVAVLLPPLAMTGTHRGAHEAVELAVQPQWRAAHINPTPPVQRATIEDITLYYFPIAYGAAILFVFAARGVRALIESRRGSITVSYPGRKVRSPRGLTILETSLRYNVPHASVCGGKARCSTCRVRVISDRTALPPPSGRESFVLARVGASANPAIRLACQLRPKADIAVIPVLPANVGADFVRNRHRINIGEEHYVVSMFIDMRGSTRMAEKHLPFDTMFIINRFVTAVSSGIQRAGGQPNQFVGDGILALFGLDADPAVASRQAIDALAKIAANVEQLNRDLAEDGKEPIRYGIGVNGGDVIVGDIGFRENVVFTALGDPVNVAARLQDMTKEFACEAVIAEEVCRNAGLPPDPASTREVTIRGRDRPLTVRLAHGAGLVPAGAT